jgi:amino acid adenylation domain-containing protein
MVVDEYPLSSLQQGMLFHALSVPHSGVDIEQITIDYREPLRLDLLERAWQAEADGQAVLRTSFHWIDVPEPVQRVHDSVLVSIDRRQASDEESFKAFLSADRSLGFDLSVAPLSRLTVFEMGPDHFRLVWSLHHMLMDGRAFVIVLSEVQEQYDRLRRDELPMRKTGPGYRPYVEWQRSQDLSGATAFWRSKLAGLDGPTPLPPDSPEEGADTTELIEGEISEACTSALARIAGENGITLNTIVMGVWGILLARYTGTTRIVFGAVKTARAGSVPDASSVVGLFLNTVPVRMDFDGDPPVIEALMQLRAEWLSLREYEFAPLSLIKHAASLEGLNFLFDTIVVFENERFDRMLSASLPCWRTRDVKLVERTGYALTLKAFAGPDMLLQIEFDHHRISAATARRILAHVQHLLRSISEDPQATVGGVRLLTETETDLLLRGWNRTEAAYPREVPLAALVERQVDETPGAVAVVYGEEAITYRDLNTRANRLAHNLRAQGAGPDVVVGICLERSVDMVVGLLAIIKAGAAYLPLDPLLPPDRLRYMIEDSHLGLVVTGRRLRAGLPDFPGTIVSIDEALSHGTADDDPHVEVAPGHLAYVIYTSGSTGRPKGVQVPRGALTNLLWSMRDWLSMTGADRVLALTTISFDIAGLELWLPLLVGAQVIVASREAAADAGQLRALLERHDVTFLQATPVTWRLLTESEWPGKGNLQAVCTGEAMPQDLAAALALIVPRLWNLYGPTETTIWSTGYVIQQRQGPVLIGRPLPNTRCYILDTHRQPVPVGVVGELYIGGDGVARGYLNRPELTAEKFLPDPFCAVPGARMYQTGDLARHHPNGDIECLGRTDHQVKIRGFRIELGEIEARLAECEGAGQSVVVARADAGREKRLVAYVVPKPGSTVNASRVKEQLRTTLPEYMVPASVAVLDAMPMTPNGKIDRAALPAPGEGQPALCDRYRAPRNSVEFALAKIWAKALGVERVSIDDNFFDLGGDSLLSVAVISRVLELFPDMTPSLAQLLHAPTVAQFAEVIGHAAVPPDIVVKLRDGKPGRAPFFCVPGAGGNVLSLRALARAMPEDLPFYALQAKGLDGSTPFVTVEDTARCYAEKIRTIQPSGPYHLGGACYGGLVAFETARVLEADGESVRLLALMDTTNFAYGSTLPWHRMLSANLRFYWARMWHVLRKTADLPADRRRAHIVSQTRAALRVMRQLAGFAIGSRSTQFPDLAEFPPGPDDSEFSRILFRVRDASLQAASTFLPEPYRGQVLLFKAATREHQIYDDETLGWAPVALGGVTAVEVPGDHLTMFGQPHVREIARTIAAALERCSDRARKS